MTATQITLRTDRSTAALVAQYIRELAAQGSGASPPPR